MKVIQPSMEFCGTLTDLPLFSSLSGEQRMTLLKCAEVVACDKGELFFRQGDPAESFLILKTGRVKMRKLSPSGHEVVLHLAGPPHMIGCKGLTLPGSTYPADAVAVDAAIALRFTRKRFLQTVADMPDVFFELLIVMNRRLSEIFMLQSALLEPVECRIANLLLNQAFPEEANLEKWQAYPLRKVNITKSLIASIVGTTTETAIRVLSKWRKAGIIKSERGCTEILDPQTVIDIAMQAGTADAPIAKQQQVHLSSPRT